MSESEQVVSEDNNQIYNDITEDMVTKFFDWKINLKRAGISFLVTIFAFLAAGFHWFPFICLSALVYFVTRLMKPATGYQIEQLYEHYGNICVGNAIKECDCEEDEMIQKPDWFWYPSNGITNSPVKYREQDGVWRCNTRSFVVMLYGPDSIMTYEIHYCVEDNQISTDTNSEYFFDDVAGIEISNEQLELRTSGGSKIFPMAAQGSTSLESNGKDRADQVSTSVRSILRMKKTGK